MAAPVYRSLVQDSTRWQGFALRPGDIVITTPPKCGTTWMQRICSLLVFKETTLERPLARTSPWLDMVSKRIEDVVAELESQTHRRFIKTHTPLAGLPMDDRVRYVCVGRDPRDAGVSWGHHAKNLDPEVFFKAREESVGTDGLAEILALDPPLAGETVEERFWAWVDNPSAPIHTTSSLAYTLHHLEDVLRARDLPNVELFHYADLEADLEGEMRRLAAWLEIEIPAGAWPVLAGAATFETMKQRADEMVPNADQKLWKDNRKFFHSGTAGGWRAFFDDAAQARYAARVHELTSPEVAAWAERGGR